MLVHPEGDADVAVPHDFRDDVRQHPHLQHQGNGCVPQVMKAHVWQPGFLEQPLENAAQVDRVKVRSCLAAKHLEAIGGDEDADPPATDPALRSVSAALAVYSAIAWEKASHVSPLPVDKACCHGSTH